MHMKKFNFHFLRKLDFVIESFELYLQQIYNSDFVFSDLNFFTTLICTISLK
jgi:hypothetical protein